MRRSALSLGSFSFWFVPKSIATFYHIRKQAIQQELASNNALLIFLLTQKAHCFLSLFAMRESGMALLSISICKIGTEEKK